MPTISPFGTPVDERSAASAFARAARIALLGLLAPGAIGLAAAALGWPLPRVARRLLDVVPVAAFAASGAAAAGMLRWPRRGRRWVIMGYAIAGLAVAPAYDSLAGLTGREPVALVAGIVGAAFAAGFGAAGAAAFVAIGRTGWQAVRGAGHGALAGAGGALIALVPFLAAASRWSLETHYVDAALVVGSTLACVIVPAWLVGIAVDRTGR